MPTAASPFAIGDLVLADHRYAAPNHSGAYRVRSVSDTDVLVSPATGRGKPLRAPHAYFVAAPADVAAAVAAGTGYSVSVPVAVWHDAGTIVTVAGPTWHQPDGLYVVLAGAQDYFHLAPLGGHPDGTTYPKIPAGMLTTIDATTLTHTPTSPDAVSETPGACS